MNNQIKFFHCNIQVDFRDTDYSPAVVRAAIEKAPCAQQPAFLTISEEDPSPPEEASLLVRAILSVYRKFLELTRRFKARRHE